MSDWSVLHGDCLEVLKNMADDSVDAVVTHPPYGLSFMGKRWDYDVPSVEIWAECLRVLKPGGHLLAFAGTRTQHRMAVRIEDAGFEIRDMIAWVYGSGFPKSLDVSKAIDKMDAAEEQMARRYRFTAWVRSTGVTSRQIDEATSTNMGGHYTTAASQPAIMTREHLDVCRHLFGDVPEWVEREADIRSVESKNFAEREVVGQRAVPVGHSFAGPTYGGDSSNQEVNITTPATPEAQQWSGWGTALKPALEPITVARKPLVGTVAANVLEHGTGGLNVDGCRVGAEARPVMVRTETVVAASSMSGQSTGATSNGETTTTGRWPANLIHDGSDEVVGLFPVTKPATSRSGAGWRSAYVGGDRGVEVETTVYEDGGGSAARFFYCAKASKADRDEGCEGLGLKRTAKLGGADSDREDLDPVSERFRTQPSRNNHPTVKPTDLMRYLCRLVTPPGGLVLDPFAGSGSTGKGAVLEGFRFVGIEREAEYVEIARRRIAHAVPKQLGLL
jgi:DNA modification methylase